MNPVYCPLCGSPIMVIEPPPHLRSIPYYGERLQVTCSNDDCRPVDSKIFGKDYGMTKAVISFFLSSDDYFTLSEKDKEYFKNILRENYVQFIRERFIREE